MNLSDAVPRTTQCVIIIKQGSENKGACNVCGWVSGRVYRSPGDASKANEKHRAWNRRCRPGVTPVNEWTGLRWQP